MAKRIKLKPGNTSLNVRGIGVISEGNITPEMYDRLISLSPAFADFFEFSDEEPKAKPVKEQKPKTEPKSE